MLSWRLDAVMGEKMQTQLEGKCIFPEEKSSFYSCWSLKLVLLHIQSKKTNKQTDAA